MLYLAIEIECRNCMDCHVMTVISVISGCSLHTRCNIVIIGCCDTLPVLRLPLPLSPAQYLILQQPPPFISR